METRIIGRVIQFRRHGGIAFVRIRTQYDEPQIVLQRQNLLDYQQLVTGLQLGCWVSVVGTPGRTAAGEDSIFATEVFIHSVPRRSLDDFYGVNEDAPSFLHMMTSLEAREAVWLRATVLNSLRTILGDSGYTEVETPILNSHPGGNAQPFLTYHNSRDSELALRIAPEHNLRRLLISGFERVYEIGRNFRNEGADRTHNPEFTMLEAYAIGQTWHEARQMVEDLIRGVAREISLNLPIIWPSLARGNATTFDEEVAPNLIEPTWVIDFPEDECLLTRAVNGVAEHFDLYMQGLEVATGDTEETNPDILRTRGLNDEALIQDMEWGMPPTGGFAIGIDRLLMVLMRAQGIRQIYSIHR